MRTLSFVPALISAAAVATVSLGAQTAQTQTAGATNQADAEKGRQTVQQVCVACHNNALRMIQSQKRSADQWRDTVYSMIGRGAHVFPEEIDPLIAFLVANSGRSQAPTTPTGQAAPASEGRAILERSCQECHDLETATKKLAGTDWGTLVGTMIGYGARVSATDQQTLIEYLNGLPQ